MIDPQLAPIVEMLSKVVSETQSRWSKAQRFLASGILLLAALGVLLVGPSSRLIVAGFVALAAVAIVTASEARPQRDLLRLRGASGATRVLLGELEGFCGLAIFKESGELGVLIGVQSNVGREDSSYVALIGDDNTPFVNMFTHPNDAPQASGAGLSFSRADASGTSAMLGLVKASGMAESAPALMFMNDLKPSVELVGRDEPYLTLKTSEDVELRARAGLVALVESDTENLVLHMSEDGPSVSLQSDGCSSTLQAKSLGLFNERGLIALSLGPADAQILSKIDDVWASLAVDDGRQASVDLSHQLGHVLGVAGTEGGVVSVRHLQAHTELGSEGVSTKLDEPSPGEPNQ